MREAKAIQGKGEIAEVSMTGGVIDKKQKQTEGLDLASLISIVWVCIKTQLKMQKSGNT